MPPRRGSPPQVRGKLMGYHYTDGVDRITPAGAGKTVSSIYNLPHQRDHPRRCGENFIYSIVTLSVKGSPPQVRGKLEFCQKVSGIRGITPAGAGKTGRMTN